MFFGKALTSSQSFTFTAEDENALEILTLTNVSLAPSSKEGASLYVKKGNEEFLVASLTKERPQATINIFVTLEDSITLVVKGNGTVHVIGFFEPEGDNDLNEQLEGLVGEDDEEEEEEESNDEDDAEEDSEDEDEDIIKQVSAQATKLTASNMPTQKQAPQVQAKSPAQKPKSPAQAPAPTPKAPTATQKGTSPKAPVVQ